MIITSPTNTWIQDAIGECRRSIAIASPYVGDYLRKAVAQLEIEVSVTLLTRTLLADFASNASDLDAIRALAVRSNGILSLSSLHAKVYVIDQNQALITSANATFGGMYRNRECGFQIRARQDVRRLGDLIHSGFGSVPRPQIWSAAELDELREPVERLRAALPRVSRMREATIETISRVRLNRRQYRQLAGSFSGWLRLTLEGLARMSRDVFTMDDVFAACAPLAASQFPDNTDGTSC